MIGTTFKRSGDLATHQVTGMIGSRVVVRRESWGLAKAITYTLPAKAVAVVGHDIRKAV